MENKCPIVDKTSLSAVFIECYCKGIGNNKEALGTGSGFFVNRERCVYLITNWHVVFGRNFDTGKKFCEDDFIDVNCLSLSYYCRYGNKAKRNKIEINVDENNILVYDNKSCNKYKRDGREFLIPSVDIVAIKIPSLNEIDLFFAEDSIMDHAVKVDVNITDPITVLGFPLGLKDSTGLPIHKLSFLASEPDIVSVTHPYFLIDTNSRHGMSGSIVFYRKKRLICIYSKGKISVKYDAAILGVYAGRFSDESNEIQSHLGRVWSYSFIDAIIFGKQLKTADLTHQKKSNDCIYAPKVIDDFLEDEAMGVQYILEEGESQLEAYIKSGVIECK